MQIKDMRAEHVDEVHAIECASFKRPWARESIMKETENSIATYIVALSPNGRVLGYAGMWHIAQEGHITNIAVSPGHRRSGCGALLLSRLINIAAAKDMIGLTLEVRASNHAAMMLYQSRGFTKAGIRKAYYQDNSEDAIIMWKWFE